MTDQDNKKTFMVVGLGNPGKKYERTRHNIGFMVVQELAKAKQWSLKEDSRWPGIAGKGSLGDVSVHLLMPTTYMNESGRAIQRYLAYHKLTPAHLIVVYDDIDVDFGVLKLRPAGSAGGHNGLKSIQGYLGTTGYKRVRMGIGDREHGDLADYVLSEFNGEEQSQLNTFLAQGTQAIEELLRSDIHTLMNRVNVRKKAQEEKLIEQRTQRAQENEHESKRTTEPL